MTRAPRARARRPARAALALFAVALAACSARELAAAPPAPEVLPPLPAPESRLVLTGDAGDDDAAPLLRALGAFVAQHGERTTLAFLGDNFYPTGGAGRDPALRARLLRAQLDAGRAAAATWLVPGNHDWASSKLGPPDVSRLRALAGAVDADPRAEWAPEAGCGGPESIDRGDFVLVALDSEWWLLGDAERAAAAPPGGCAQATPEAAERALVAALACSGAAPCAPRILIAHHPLATRGPHGTRAVGLREDLGSRAYQAYARAVRRATAAHPPLLVAAGHDHSLQVLPGAEPPVQVVSGAAGHTTSLAGGLAYGSSRNGVMAVDFLPDDRAVLRIFELTPGAPCGPSPLCETFRQRLRPPP